MYPISGEKPGLQVRSKVINSLSWFSELNKKEKNLHQFWVKLSASASLQFGDDFPLETLLFVGRP